ncbi:MAG: 6,7-dimethyl-8-ribityllumazine synthase [Alphaproteobacteria bacterium]
MAPHIAIIEARFYTDIADELYAGACAVLDRQGVSHERIAVPGVLEIPGALAMIVSGKGSGLARQPDGFVLLGCVIRGETTHYDIVANESARAILNLTTDHGLAVGNGIQTVENREQALVRARVGDKNKGGGAAQAALAMVALRERFGLNND